MTAPCAGSSMIFRVVDSRPGRALPAQRGVHMQGHSAGLGEKLDSPPAGIGGFFGAEQSTP